jgi:hypothetical protein
MKKTLTTAVLALLFITMFGQAMTKPNIDPQAKFDAQMNEVYKKNTDVIVSYGHVGDQMVHPVIHTVEVLVSKELYNKKEYREHLFATALKENMQDAINAGCTKMRIILKRDGGFMRYRARMYDVVR